MDLYATLTDIHSIWDFDNFIFDMQSGHWGTVLWQELCIGLIPDY